MSYVPHSDADRQAMLAQIGVESVEELFMDVPEAVRYPEVKLPRPLSEMEILAELQALSEQNADLNHYLRSVAGLGLQQQDTAQEIGSLLHPHQPQLAQAGQVSRPVGRFEALTVSLDTYPQQPISKLYR